MEAKKEWRWIDKSGWGDGQWTEEPDKLQWQDDATGLPCLIRRNGLGGNLCGYVGVPEGHPWFEKNYSDIEVEVHGGLTYSDHCDDEDKVRGICHVAEDGIKRWWLGFDAAHSWDVQPEPRLRGLLGFGPVTYKTVEYMQAECEQLAQQINAAK